MRKILIIFASIFILSAVALADTGELSTDGLGIRVQGFAPNPKKQADMTVYKATKDMRSDVQWNIYCAGASIFRTLSTTTVVGTGKVIPATTWTTRVVDRANGGFTSFSGCVGKLERM